jgi:hypothetical protein
MAFGKKKHKRHKVECPRCFAYVSPDSRKCKFCSYTFKSPGKYLVDKIKHALKIDRVFSVRREKPSCDAHNFFTFREIEKLTRFDNVHILMFMRLDDISLLDEMILIELGETIMSMNNKH